ncbi:MAG TPA: indolepyruvate oxidoreductase subunit beta [Dermatophilaceae bacterium]|nr:indolepyruvate oxidoreductase subunit beta [Dermatophilaceae bacterium]
MNKHDISIVLVGVGGQGTILASDILAELGMRLGYDVKKAEVHGMSQRGGSVISHLRWAPQVFSAIIPKGGADILVAFEKMEAVRYADLLKPDGMVIINNHAIEPLTVITGGGTYPADEAISHHFEDGIHKIYWIEGVRIATELGNKNVANVVLLGALSSLLELPDDEWDAVLEKWVPPKFIDLNKRAFKAGQDALGPAIAAQSR